LLEHVTGDDVFAEILMLRTADARAIVLLESDSDCAALDSHILKNNARTLPTWSKSALLRAMTLVEERRIKQIVGLADRDFDGVLFAVRSMDSLIYTDRYDLDATILLTGNVLERLLASFADRDSLSSHLASSGTSAADAVIEMAGPVGYGRYVSIRDRLEVRFNDFPVHACVDRDTGTVSLSLLAGVAVSRSRQPACERVEFARLIRDGLKRAGNLGQYCSGHDLAAAISHMVRTQWGNGRVSKDLIERSARAAFDCESLRATEFYEKVNIWALEADAAIWAC